MSVFIDGNLVAVFSISLTLEEMCIIGEKKILLCSFGPVSILVGDLYRFFAFSYQKVDMYQSVKVPNCHTYSSQTDPTEFLLVPCTGMPYCNLIVSHSSSRLSIYFLMNGTNYRITNNINIIHLLSVIASLKSPHSAARFQRAA